MAVAVHCWGEECHVTQLLLHTANMPVVPVLTPGARVRAPTCRLCAGFSFSLPSGTCICFWRTCRAAGILTLICFRGVPVQSMRDTARADDGSVSRLGVALTRRLLANCVAASTSRVCGSGLNQCLTFFREVGIPHPFPSKSSCWICLWPSGVRAFPWPPSARTWQGCSISASVSASRRRWRVDILSGCAARPPTLPGRPLPAAAWATYQYHPDSSSCVHSPPLPGSRRYHAPRRGLLRLLWPAALRGILLPLSAPLCPGVHLQYSDLPLDPERGVGICASRRQRQIPTEGGGGGGSPCVSAASAPFCPFTALHQLLGTHPTFAGPCSPSGPGHTCDLHTHSFRLGGASAAGAMGFSSA